MPGFCTNGVYSHVKSYFFIAVLFAVFYYVFTSSCGGLGLI